VISDHDMKKSCCVYLRLCSCCHGCIYRPYMQSFCVFIDFILQCG